MVSDLDAEYLWPEIVVIMFPFSAIQGYPTLPRKLPYLQTVNTLA